MHSKHNMRCDTRDTPVMMLRMKGMAMMAALADPSWEERASHVYVWLWLTISNHNEMEIIIMRVAEETSKCYVNAFPSRILQIKMQILECDAYIYSYRYIYLVVCCRVLFIHIQYWAPSVNSSLFSKITSNTLLRGYNTANLILLRVGSFSYLSVR